MMGFAGKKKQKNAKDQLEAANSYRQRRGV